MISFDIDHPKYFTLQEKKQQYLTRTIYILLGLHTFWILSGFSKKRIYAPNKSYFEMTKMMKIPIITFLFFISDEFERILLLFLYFSVVKQLYF